MMNTTTMMMMFVLKYQNTYRLRECGQEIGIEPGVKPMTQTTPSAPPLAIRFPSGDTATE
jgi:hypothetical protein